jgi:hypothetical protein
MGLVPYRRYDERLVGVEAQPKLASTEETA